MKKVSKIVLGALLCVTGLAIPANAATDSGYSIYFAAGKQNAALNIHGGERAAVGTYQNFPNGYVYTKCSTNYGDSKSLKRSQNAGFMVSGTKFTTYHEMVGGGHTNKYSR